MTGNNVRGPTSALTEFLRESGISALSIARRVRDAETQGAEGTPRAEPSNSNGSGGANTEEQRHTPQRNRPNVNYDSDHLDEEDERRSKKRKTLAEEKEKSNAKSNAKGQKKGGDDDNFEDDSDEDVYTTLSRGPMRNAVKAAMPGAMKPPVGAFETCEKCGKKFTVTRYTMAAFPGPGWLCHDCVRELGADPFKLPATPRKRKTVGDQRKIVSFEERELSSLASMCIKIISRHIDDVESLGDVSLSNRIEIGRVLAKNRSLTPENAILLYDVRNTELRIFDATKLGPGAFCTLASLNPSLISLRLDFCGLLNDDALKFIGQHVPQLQRIELLGPFNVRSAGWQSFFTSCCQLTGFLITQSSRFDIECMAQLCQHCPNLKELRLSQIGHMNDDFMGHVEGLKHLTSLDLSEPGEALTQSSIIRLLEHVGPSLTHLNLSRNNLLGDDFVTDGLLPNVRVLASLVLEDVPEISDEVLGAFFENTENVPMHYISLSRNHTLADNSLLGLLKHSGTALTELNIHSWKSISNDALMKIGEYAPMLRTIDLGFCRQVDAFAIKSILDGCGKIKDIAVFGCNKLAEECPSKPGVSIRGIENHVV